jgi:hypothetical protein
MITFKNILQEYDKKTRSKKIDYEKLLIFIKKNCNDFIEYCKNNKGKNPGDIPFICRYTNTPYEYAVLDPKKFKRESINAEDDNYHVEIMSNSEYWKDYPKYDESIIGVLANPNLAPGSLFGEFEFVVVPFDNAKIAMCPKRYIPECFIKGLDVSWSHNLFQRIRNYIAENGGMYNKIGAIENSEEYKSITKSMLQYFYVNLIAENNKLDDFFKAFFKTEFNNLYDFIDYRMNPELNDFSLSDSKNIYTLKKHKGDQVFTDSKCLLIKYGYRFPELFEYITNYI